MQHHQLYLKNEAATLRLGKELARATFRESTNAGQEPAAGQGVPSTGGIIHLHGELGAGKTTLTRGIMRGYGYQGAVKSPTYTLVEPYEFEFCNIYHFDLYRLADPGEVEYLGTEDYFAPGNLCIIEWAERGAGTIAAADISLQLSAKGSGRQLLCQPKSSLGEEIAKRLWTTGRNL